MTCDLSIRGLLPPLLARAGLTRYREATFTASLVSRGTLGFIPRRDGGKVRQYVSGALPS